MNAGSMESTAVGNVSETDCTMERTMPLKLLRNVGSISEMPFTRFSPIIGIMSCMYCTAPSMPPLSKAAVRLVISCVPCCTNCRNLLSVPFRASYIAIFAPSAALPKRVMSPSKLLSCVAACSAVEPLASAKPVLNFSILSAEVFAILLKASSPCMPKMEFLYAFASSSESPDRALLNSSTTVLKSLALPLVSYAETPRLSKAFFAVSVGV